MMHLNKVLIAYTLVPIFIIMQKSFTCTFIVWQTTNLDLINKKGNLAIFD